ncbi:MAG: hypothetical protein K2G63_01415 [Oscillospiraceae bacterium]|nr:hypothetical protein [Oscillospiraceae bacterium]
MNKCVTCDKCGHDFAIAPENCGEIHKGDIIVQYFYCTKCNAKYHILTTNTTMRKLIEQRVAIQNKITRCRENILPLGTIQKLQHKLDRLIVRQKKLMPNLKKRGEEILNDGDNNAENKMP